MLEFGGSAYYIDVDALDKMITSKPSDEVVETTETKDGGGNTIKVEIYRRKLQPMSVMDNVKYDLIKMFIEYVIDYESENEDDALGVERALQPTPLGYKIVFNTLLKEGILKEQD